MGDNSAIAGDLELMRGKLYYHPFRLTINDILICFFAAVLPEFCFLLIFFTLPGFKYFRYSTKLFVPVVFLTLVSFFIYIIGRERLAGGGASLAAGFYYLFVRLVPLIFLIEGLEQKRSERIILFIRITMIYLIVSFLIDAALLHTYNDRRRVVLIGHLSPANSTNYINVLVLGLSVLLLIKDRYFYVYLILLLVISFIWDNRTGLIGCGLLLTLNLLRQSRALVISIWMLILYFGTFILEHTRFGEQGLDSPRWITQLDALDDLITLQHPFGGYENYLGDTEWLHNIYLDTYRVSGLIPAGLLLIYTILPFFRIDSKRRFYRLFCILLALGIGMSSIIFEGTHLEFLFFFILIFNSQLLLAGGKDQKT